MSSAEPQSPRPPETEPPRMRSGSQSKLSPILLLVLLAAALFRIVTAATDRQKAAGNEAGLVKWIDPAAAAQAARTSGRPILYDFTAEWCGPCHVLDRDGWGDAKVAGMVNGSYVPARVVDRVQEEGRNPAWVDELQRRYQVNAFPTLVVATADGRQVAVAQGYGGKEKLLEFLRSSREKAAAPPSAR